jgi:endo-1,4-beta-xylanase
MGFKIPRHAEQREAGVEARTLARRTFIGSALALGACGKPAKSASVAPPPALTLKEAAPFPVGCAVTAAYLADPAYAALLTRQVSQLTPEWEMKMEYILQDDGAMRFDAPDAIAAFARGHGMRLFGHNLVWYAQGSPAFERLTGDAFARTYRNYIVAVAGRYRGITSGWDVVNEPVNEDGSALRDCLWSNRLGQIDYMVRAFDHAAEADPAAVLFVNDYNLESLPKKRAQFMRMVETLLKRGCKLGGLGTQTHIDIDLPKGAVAAALKDLATFGLPIHLSELDIATHIKKVDLRSVDDRLKLHADQARQAAEAFMALPAKQRFAFTIWGLRDKDSWLRGPNGSSPEDKPMLFDDNGAAKPALTAVIGAFSKR